MTMSKIRGSGEPLVARPYADDLRYGMNAIILHWIIALLIVAQIGIGWYMNKVLPDHSAAQARLVSLHISLGLTTLLLVLVRIGMRLVYRPPPLPPEVGPAERWLVGATQALFYLLMLALPLTGWMLVSIGSRPISFWGAHWPHLPGLSFLAGPEHRPLRHTLQQTHTDFLVWIVLANLVLHVAGAWKHQLDGRPVLWRMWPFIKPRPTSGGRP
jgi:cytochrome b561